MSTTPLPSDRRTIDDLLTKARTRNRYTDYNMAAAEARLRSRQAARHRPPRQRTPGSPAPTVWTAPDADRAWWDLNAVSLLILFGPDADHQLADFITSQYADQTGALVFACLLHLAGDSNGARFWWRFAADADHWRTQLMRHHFDPTLLCGDRTTAPHLIPELIGDVHPHITRPHHPEIGTVPLPQPPLVQQLRHLASLL
ncbi:hypothetical protein [Streptomyces bluensis]|uniref:Uncharacterized protein n=1 Tax=Streptomyces bluensis TaxID=33897 RepID=A0ABW6UVA4_9ACTN